MDALDCHTLYGRESELARIDSLVEDSQRGRGNTLLVNGPVGSGKTALSQALVDRLTGSDALVLTATAAKAERDIPLGVLEQLLRSAALPAEFATVVAALLGDDPTSTQPRPPAAELVQRLCAAILDLAQHRLVVIVVDELQHADDESLQALLHMQRRMRTRCLLLVLNELTSTAARLSVFHAELFRQPRCHRLRLRLLSADSVAGMFRAGLDKPVSEDLSRAAVHACGGNPLLLNALIEDHHLVTAVRLVGEDELVTAESFRHAITACLLRMDADTGETARGLAVLGAAAEPVMLARLLGLPVETVSQSLVALAEAGLAEAGRFRHVSAGESVLDMMAPEARAELHRRAARLLHEHGAEPRTTARQLITSGQASEAWMVTLLRDVADEALAADEVDLAVDCLELALFACPDEPGRAAVMALLARIEWRDNPSAARRFIRPLRVALRRGRLGDSDAGMLVRFLIWDGRITQAEETLNWWTENVTEPTAELHFTWSWLRQCCPAVVGRLTEPGARIPWQPGESVVESRPRPVPATTSPVEAVDAFVDLLGNGPTQVAIDSAERVLESQRVDDTTIEALCAALEVLVCAGQLDNAAAWCDRLLAEVKQRRVVAWQAMLGSVRAEIALRQADLHAAAAYARTALDLMSTQDWGVFIGAPLGTLVTALTMLGRHVEAGHELDRAVPAELVETRYGLQYLYARGRHSMAAGHLHAALSDFEDCGRLMSGWGIDLPALVPWRSGAAEALRKLGRHERARELVRQQLDRPGVAGSRTRGVSLRILAACADPVDRVPLLQEAVELLRAEDDRLELATTLADLSNANHLLHEPTTARLLAEHALRLVKSTEVEEPHWQPSVALGRLAALEDNDGVSLLSRAEEPVARLAAAGHTNREISRKLFVTVSTVEQHLTRVYRKLNVRNRTDLAAHLPLRVTESATA